jgi:hypothetical protein
MTIYDHLRPFSTIYDHLRTIYDNLQQSTTIYDHQQQLRTIYNHVIFYITDIYDIFHDPLLLLAFVLVLLLLPHPIMMNNVKDGLAQVHGVLQSNADRIKGILVLVSPMPEQSTQAIVEFELAVELCLSGAGAQFEVGEFLA